MPNILSQNQIILSLLDLIRISQPDASLIEGSVIRDLFIDPNSAVLSDLYSELGSISNLQSLTSATGADLDNLLSNYGLTRKRATKGSGVAVFTFSSLPSAIGINKGELVYASNGVSFAVTAGVTINPASANLYKSIATKYKNDLDFLNITDPYAIEITVQATAPGTAGNIGKYAINKTNSSSVSHVTNPQSFLGATDAENDAAFRARGLAIFSGSATGTELGYRNTALSVSGVLDALVVKPGDPLMTRDGTIVVKNSDNSYTITSEGTGNKVDIIVLGSNLLAYTDSFIYQDKSNSNDPTNSKNIFVLGQIAGDENKSITRRRIENFEKGNLPAQPVENVTQLSGTLSGSNFLPKSVDIYGRVSGNYEIIKDTGVYAGSPFALDKLHWISNKISLFQEDIVKNAFNGQDSTTFTDVLQIPTIQQNIPITNENSNVYPGDRSIVQLLHTPSTNVSRVFNVNTGERYTVTNQNVDGATSVNTTGRVRISGSTLPSVSDVLQVDYQWVISFDPYVDYDGKLINSNIRLTNDSIDWGLSNAVRNEEVLFTLNTQGSFYTGFVKHPVSAIVSASTFKRYNGVVTAVAAGSFAGRLAVQLFSLDEEVSDISNITLQNSLLEIYDTADNDGSFTNERVLVGSQVLFNSTIILPTDTPAVAGESVTAFFNQGDVFTTTGSIGNYNANEITIPATNISSGSNSVVLRVEYFANVQDALTQSITNFPISRSGNSFVLNNNVGFTNSTISNSTVRQNASVQLDTSNQPSVTLSLPTIDYSLDSSQVITVISLSTKKELWNKEHPGVVVSSGNDYALTLSGYNSPTTGDDVLVIFAPSDVKRTQPFTFGNTLIQKSVATVSRVGGILGVTTNTLVNDSSISFEVIDPSTNLSIGSGTGALAVSGNIGTINGSTVNFSTLSEVSQKKIHITASSTSNNLGTYDISSYDNVTNSVSFSNNISNLNTNQISIIRLSDNAELWSNGTIDLANSRFNFQANSQAEENDSVLVVLSNSNNLRQAPSRLSVTVSDQINNTGIVTIAGTTLNKVDSIVFTASSPGLKQNAAEAIRKSLSINSGGSIPSNLSIARIVKIERVNVTTDNEVMEVINSYDVLGASVNNNIYYANELIDDDSLTSLEFSLPSTVNNSANLPQVGDKLRVTLYYTISGDTENIAFTRNGTLFTNKSFALVDKIFISSGFSSSSARFTFSYLNQPVTGSRYKVYYDYTAPKVNERIVINYNYNRLISDVSVNIEQNRPINADVLVKAASQLLVDVTMNIVISPSFIVSSTLVLQNLRDRLTSAIETNRLGDIIDNSDLVSVAQSVDGVDRARIIYFNEAGQTGQKLSLVAQKNQYFVANNINVAQENR